MGILPAALCKVHLGAFHSDSPFSSVPRPPRCNIHSDAPFSLVPRPARCNFHLGVTSTRCSLQLGAPSSSMHGHPDYPFRSVPRLARFNLHPCAPFSSMTHPARCAVQLGAPSARSSLQFGFPFKSVPPSLPSSPTTTAGNSPATRNTATPDVTYSARNVFISFVILSEKLRSFTYTALRN